MDWVEVLARIDHSPLYRGLLFFFGFYPMFMAAVWVVMSIIFFRRRESSESQRVLAEEDWRPFVSIIIPAYAEENTIFRTLTAALQIDYPDYEVIVVNDGSPDRTADVVKRFLASGKVRLLDKIQNEGKAMALNDAIPLCRGEILLVLDADIVVTPTILQALVPHFLSPRVAAVTGNPRVANRSSLLRGLQTLEFTSIISIQRRAQRIWGRILTVSGAVAAVRKSAVLDAGMFSPDMATEDIDLTWKLQRKFWDVRYEPSAIAWMEAPPTLRELWKQRRRWAIGLAQVIWKHRGVPLRWIYRRLWPVYYESVLSILWAYTFMFVTLYWAVANVIGYSPYGSSPVPNLWGMLIATAALVQLSSGVLMDRRYDRSLPRYLPLAILYPLIYWALMSLITSIYTIQAFVRKRPKVQTWKIERAR